MKLTDILMLIGTVVVIILVEMLLIQQMDVAYANYVEENCIKDNGTPVSMNVLMASG